MISKEWRVRNINSEKTMAMARSLSLSPLTATVLLGRGVDNIEVARRWLSPNTGVLHDPFLLADMECAVYRLHQAVEQGERICCYGDYDVDGISAASLVLLFLRHYGAKIGVYIPDRKVEGYGLNESAVRKLAHEGVKLLITVDCGTTSEREVSVAKSLGVDVIIIDHHQIQPQRPAALAFLNPHRSDCQYPFTGLCSTGLVFKFASAYSSVFNSRELDMSQFTDLVSLATIADVVPLQDENRSLVRDGLVQITEGGRCGIQALRQKLGIQQSCTAAQIGFQIAPMVNAAGRLAHGLLGVELLTSESPQHVRSLADRLGELNQQRREIEQGIFNEAVSRVERFGRTNAVAVGSRGWHVGVVGIVASRLAERYHRPAVVVAFDEQGIGRGSGRSVPGLDLCRVLGQCSDLLVGFGGHPAAAGLQVHESRFPEFCERFSAVMDDCLQAEPCVPVLDIDAQVTLQEVHPQLLRELGQLHPFGMGNPEPTFVARGLKVLEQRVVGGSHLKLVVRQNNSAPFESIGFRMGAMKPMDTVWSQPIDLVFVPEVNRWKGLDRIQLRIQDFGSSESRKGCA